MSVFRGVGACARDGEAGRGEEVFQCAFHGCRCDFGGGVGEDLWELLRGGEGGARGSMHDDIKHPREGVLGVRTPT